jgi:hypothetical protein
MYAVIDLLTLLLLIVAFAGTVGYVRACATLVHQPGPSPAQDP